MYVPQEQNIDATGLRLGVVVSRYHGDITEVLCEGAVEAFLAAVVETIGTLGRLADAEGSR